MTGQVYLNSTDLELVFDASIQTVGMCWTTLALIATDTGGSPSAPVTITVNVVQAGATLVAVHPGYYDTHHPRLPKPRPSPWMGSPNTVSVGQPDNPSSSSPDWDSSVLRVQNLTAGSLSGVTVTADIGSRHFAL